MTLNLEFLKRYQNSNIFSCCAPNFLSALILVYILTPDLDFIKVQTEITFSHIWID